MTRGPYLQSGTPTSIIVRWRTSLPTQSEVHYGTNAANQNNFAIDSDLTSEHTLKVSGLSPDTRYYYSIVDAGVPLASGSDHFFVTAPSGAKPTRIWVLGDSGTAGSAAAAVRDAYTAFTGSRHTDLWLMLGDNAYPIGTDENYTAAVFDMYPDMLRKSVLWSTIGNHETYNGEAPLPYFSIFTLPTRAEAGGVPSGTENYYSFDYGNIHFVCLDAMTRDRTTTGPMASWLEQDLAANTNEWLIAFWHHPPYTKGSHDSDSEIELIEMRQNMLPILESYGVDLVLCGHSHSYERSFLLNGHYGYSSEIDDNPSLIRDSRSGRADESGPYVKSADATSNPGAVYVVAGSSGQTSGGTLDHPAMFFSVSELGSLVLDINNDRLDAQFLESTGMVSDHFSILKGNDFRITSFRVQPNAVTLSWRSESGRTYYVDYKPSLTNTTWAPVSGGIVAQGSQASWTGLRPAGTSGFYRIVRLGN
ncbi:MAG TPA: metallophosphoesterase family protein [Verrucomicrobiae bacterium]|nr:metallophosphoesterase family protein [Verrucomicrobiae bacterium]